MEGQLVDDAHLGGFIPGGDKATYYPDLWTWLVEGPLGVERVLDLGCGEGHSSRFFTELGCSVTAIDGVETGLSEQLDFAFYQHDFREPFPYLHVEGAWDLAWTCEFVEHVDEEYIHNIVPLLKESKITLMTHAFPGQQGHHHVNCRTQDYWLGFMASAGLHYSPGLTTKSREVAALNKDPYNHFLRSGLAFRRELGE